MPFIIGSMGEQREPYCKACRKHVSYVNASRRCDKCQDAYDNHIWERQKEERIHDPSKLYPRDRIDR